MGRMKEATSNYVLLDGLKALAQQLAEEIDTCEDQKLMAGLARQYRETMTQIDAIEGGEDDDDEIATIILRNRKSGAD
jgi:hypothetical protein